MHVRICIYTWLVALVLDITMGTLTVKPCESAYAWVLSEILKLQNWVAIPILILFFFFVQGYGFIKSELRESDCFLLFFSIVLFNKIYLNNIQ